MPPNPPNGIITNYRVQYRRSDSSSPNYNSNDTNTNNDLTYTVTGLTTNTEYNFRVRADTVIGRSNPSNIVTALVGKLFILKKYNCQKLIISKLDLKINFEFRKKSRDQQ